MLPPVVARSSAFRYITHFDFSDNSAYIQSNCGAYELLFFNTNDGSEVLAPSALKDEVWASQTCVLGWPVQGLWPELTDGIEINGSDRSNCGKYIVRPSSNFPPPSRPADDQLLLYPAAIDSPPRTRTNHPPSFLQASVDSRGHARVYNYPCLRRESVRHRARTTLLLREAVSSCAEHSLTAILCLCIPARSLYSPLHLRRQ